MLHLYQATELLCFPSLIEGYGLPVAEAMACGAVAIVSDVDPLRDLVAPEARFDPSEPEAIRAAIERALSDETFRKVSREARLGDAHNLGGGADRTVAAYEAVLVAPSPARKAPAARPYCRPLAIPAAGVGDRQLHLSPCRGAGVHRRCRHRLLRGRTRPIAGTEPRSGRPAHLRRPLVPADGSRHAGYDQVVYVLGNSEFHAAALASLRRRRGIVLLTRFG